MHDGTRCALDGTAFPACRYQTQGVSRPSDVIIFSFHDLVVLPRLLCEPHARTQIKGRKRKNNDSATCMACTAPRNRVQRAMAAAGWLTDWLAAGRLAWAGLNLPKKKNKKDSPRSHNHDFATHDSIPDAMGLLSCPTHYAGAAFPRSLRRFHKRCFFCCCLSSLSSTYLTYLTSF